jgi:hypothetical protein
MIWSKAIDDADEMVQKAFEADRMADSHHYFQIAEALYRKAGTKWSAEWAAKKAEVCRKLMEKATA